MYSRRSGCTPPSDTPGPPKALTHTNPRGDGEPQVALGLVDAMLRVRCSLPPLQRPSRALSRSAGSPTFCTCRLSSPFGLLGGPHRPYLFYLIPMRRPHFNRNIAVHRPSDDVRTRAASHLLTSSCGNRRHRPYKSPPTQGYFASFFTTDPSRRQHGQTSFTVPRHSNVQGTDPVTNHPFTSTTFRKFHDYRGWTAALRSQ